PAHFPDVKDMGPPPVRADLARGRARTEPAPRVSPLERPPPMTTPQPPADPSRNAVTHGLTARRPLCEQEAAHLRIVVDTWTTEHMPETEAEEALLRASAVEYVRYLRCVQAEEAQLGPNARTALAEWEEKRRHAIRRKAQDLKADPARVAAELLESAFGIDWMTRHWKALLGHLDGRRGWTSNDLELALNLLGLPYRK